MIRRRCALPVVQPPGVLAARWREACGPAARCPGGPVPQRSKERLSLGRGWGLGGHVVQKASESGRIRPDPAKIVEFRRILDRPLPDSQWSPQKPGRPGVAQPSRSGSLTEL